MAKKLNNTHVKSFNFLFLFFYFFSFFLLFIFVKLIFICPDEIGGWQGSMNVYSANAFIYLGSIGGCMGWANQ